MPGYAPQNPYEKNLNPIRLAFLTACSLSQDLGLGIQDPYCYKQVIYLNKYFEILQVKYLVLTNVLSK